MQCYVKQMNNPYQTLRNGEQGRRTPAGPARVLLLVAAKHPDAVWDVVHSAAQ